ncbi:DUF1878 family protein [Brevibacillus laterosporus]|uniref:DUF1878 family protein n=1 Tax=Brevibacillus laterosporus TaxID=1465 RepID=UPI00037E276B|nr:DUF1878 family protein [Brevibacillus laterosporus]ATO51499.1 DUF1878 domain-containing protein [Brevibacillus laterosporus DSM 25]MBG9801650.1 hypothetical protein [Brevibacillus laterosporus]MED2006335.1 DUF1878 family protein [Brevibacillus laterosporus]MED4766218.1 DUF1878 family protein [Brevibacillus laterosporus]TPH14076.1 DUF1878 family protein [Brevibacillus laterosporus]
MTKETLEQRLERLEFYLNLMREFAVDPETFALWDYVISEGLSENQTKQILEVLREHHGNIKSAVEAGASIPDLEGLFSKMIPLLHIEGRTTSKEKVMQILRRASKLPIFPYLNKHL